MKEFEFRNKICNYKMVLAISIMFIHSYNIDIYGIELNNDVVSTITYYIEVILLNLQSVCVPFFFIISGYLFFRTFTWNSIKSKYSSRIRTVFLPYLLWVGIYFLYYFILTHTPIIAQNMNMPKVNISTLIQLLLFSKIPLWFLRALLFYIAIHPIIYLLFNDKNRKCKFGALLLIVTIILCMYINSDYLQPSYLFGAYIGINHKSVPLLKTRISKNIGMILLIINSIYLSLFPLKVPAINTVSQILLSIGLWYTFDGSKPNKILSQLSSATFFIYASHDLILEAIEKLIYILLKIHPWVALFDYFIAPTLTIIIIMLIRKTLLKVPIIWNVLNGER